MTMAGTPSRWDHNRSDDLAIPGFILLVVSVNKGTRMNRLVASAPFPAIALAFLLTMAAHAPMAIPAE
jgi:hypothetical protein